MELKKIYSPIRKELDAVEEVIKNSLRKSEYKSLFKVNDYLLSTGGKRIRPALVLLSAKAEGKSNSSKKDLINIAAAVELIHLASLIHDDVIDNAHSRHKKQSINSKWGNAVSLVLGDYLFSVAFELIAKCANQDVVQCISIAVKMMCEGELLQVLERDNLRLVKKQYVTIIKKKTASLFAASCQAGSLLSSAHGTFQCAFKEYGLNFGIAFQIIDDYLDLIGEEDTLGKKPGQDIKEGEITLPILDLWEDASREERKKLRKILAEKTDNESLRIIKSRLVNSKVVEKTQRTVSAYLSSAKYNLDVLPKSQYKEGLLKLPDFIFEGGFNKALC